MRAMGLRYTVATMLYRRLASYPYGKYETPKPPGDSLSIRTGEPDDDGRPMHVINTSNDGFELWIGYSSAWLFHCGAGEARRIAWFVLWDWWVKATWCGLRRRLWYWALSTHLRGHFARLRRAGYAPIDIEKDAAG